VLGVNVGGDEVELGPLLTFHFPHHGLARSRAHAGVDHEGAACADDDRDVARHHVEIGI
jgi:hypothetical protein